MLRFEVIIQDLKIDRTNLFNIIDNLHHLKANSQNREEIQNYEFLIDTLTASKRYLEIILQRVELNKA